MKLDSEEKENLDDAGKGRIDFARGIPELLYKRAGGRCSVPRCKTPTMGPFSDEHSAVNMGIACHIFSAAEQGPRGRGGKDANFISSAENGIWCCTYHGALIDKAKGKDYSAATLFAWKNLAEARVFKQMNDVPSPLGWVESIEFTQFANREGLPKIELSRYTVIKGDNGAGKSVLMEIAASVSNGKYGDRFLGSKITSLNGTLQPAVFCAELTYSTVDNLDKKIIVEIRDHVLTRTEGRIPCLLPPGDIEIILASGRGREQQSDEDDVEFMMRLLDIDKTALFALAKIGAKSVLPGEIEFCNATDEDEEGNISSRKKENGSPYIELRFKKKERQFSTSFSSLSGGERVCLIVDMFISKAREVCKQRLTLLMIDDVISNFDENNFSNLLKKLSEEDFQSVVILPPGQYRKTLEIKEDKPKLKKLDYLEPWRLVVVDALDSVEERARRNSQLNCISFDLI